MNITPFSPPKGEATQSEHPRDSLFYQPSTGYRNSGGCPGGGGKKHEMQRAPKSDFSVPRKDFSRAGILFTGLIIFDYGENLVFLILGLC
jgi:hypothetical protein